MLKSESLYGYVARIKRKKNDIHSIINTTLIINPYITNFPKDFLFKKISKQNKAKLFLVNTIKFYLYHFLAFSRYVQTFVYYKILYKKKYKSAQQDLVLDVFVLVDSVIKEGEFNDDYFSALYPILKKKNIQHVFIPRLYGLSWNPFKLHQQLKGFFQVINKDTNFFLFEFELLSVKDFFQLAWLVLCYPFKTLRLLVKEVKQQDISFNNHLLRDISQQHFETFSRYIFGKNIAKIRNISKIYSWSEFQVIERSFNYAIRKNSDIKVYACQFLVNYPVYFNMHVQDIDEVCGSAPNKVLVNGSHYLLERKKVDYQLGVSLRYQNIFEYQSQNIGSNVVLLGAYFINETMSMLKLISDLDAVIFKGHPAVDIDVFRDVMGENIKVTNENIYNLFPETALIIGSATGSLAEAIACGVSIIVVARENELITNPLLDMGKGKMWDIVFNKIEVEQKLKKLLEFRNKNMGEIKDIAAWYKDNLFIEPSEENIVKTFELNKK
jgi:hypothetical protein